MPTEDSLCTDVDKETRDTQRVLRIEEASLPHLIRKSESISEQVDPDNGVTSPLDLPFSLRKKSKVFMRN